MDFLKTNDPYKLDWGVITPEGYNKSENEVIHIFNFDVSSKEKIKRILIFSIGKIKWASRHIPPGCKQKIIFDLRGQHLTVLNQARKMKEEIINNIKNDEQSSTEIVVEFLI